MAYNNQSDIYSQYNDNYDPSNAERARARYAAEAYAAPQPVRMKAYHMKGRILSFLSFPLGLATIVMVLLAFVGPITSADSANITCLSLVTGFLGMLLGLAGKIRGRKELDLPRWPSSFGMMLGFLGLLISGMVVFASIQNYMGYGEKLAEMNKAEEDDESVVSYATGDGGTRAATEAERKNIDKAEKSNG